MVGDYLLYSTFVKAITAFVETLSEEKIMDLIDVIIYVLSLGLIDIEEEVEAEWEDDDDDC
jgi:hypothetical protein